MAAIAVAAAIAAACTGTTASAATTVFSDTFGSSSLNPASYPTPTATSTGYTIASTKNATSSIASGDLRFGMAATTSGFVETQARFATTPTTLANDGDYIEYTATFTNGNNLLAGGTSSGLYFGLYNTGNSNPVTGLQSSGLNTTAGSSFATGNAANFQGYNGRILASGGSSQVFTRPVQNGAGTTSANQDLLGNGAGGGLYNNPTGANLGQTTSTVTLAANGVYTTDLIILLNADGSQTITSSLYSGTDTTGTVLSTQVVNVAAGSVITSSFDGLALGYRQSGTSLATQIDVNAINVTTNVGSAPIPEPASLATIGLGGLALGARRRRRA